MQMNFEEYKVQEAIFDHHKTAFPWVKFVYVPNASKDAKTGYFNKQMGLHPGAYDIHLFWNRDSIDSPPSYLRVGIFEAKSTIGDLTTSQNKYASSMHELGAYTGYGSKVATYHQALCRWGLKPLHHGIKEPDLRTKDQKKSDNFNFFAPKKP